MHSNSSAQMCLRYRTCGCAQILKFTYDLKSQQGLHLLFSHSHACRLESFPLQDIPLLHAEMLYIVSYAFPVLNTFTQASCPD